MPVSGLRSRRGELCAAISPLADFGRSQCLGLEMRDCQAMGINFAHASFANRITAKAISARPTSPATTSAMRTSEGCLLERCELTGNRWQGQPAGRLPGEGSDLSGSEFGQIDWTSFQPAGLRPAPVRSVRAGSAPGQPRRGADHEDQQQGAAGADRPGGAFP